MLLSTLSLVHDTIFHWRISRKITSNSESLLVELPIKGLPVDEEDPFADLNEEYGDIETVSIKDSLVHQYFTHHGVCKLSSVKEFCAKVGGSIDRFYLIYLDNGNLLTLESLTSDEFCYRLVSIV